MARLLKLLVSRFDEMPALGRSIVPREAEANEVFERPPAGTAPTWLCCIL